MSNRKKIFIYAVFFFTSALLVLLVTGYSQQKFNNSINEYKDLLSTSEQEKHNYNMNLSEASEENKKLTDKMSSLEEELLKSESIIKSFKNEITTAKEKSDTTISSYENLIKADELYRNNSFKECAIILLDNVDIKSLSESALSKYNYLRENSMYKGALQFYKDGYKYYKEEKYEDAIKNFDNSLKLSEKEYFSDDCYYYISYSHYRLKNYDLAKKTIKTLFNYYPESTFINEAKYLSDIIGSE